MATAQNKRPDRPRFTGVDTYSDRLSRFQFRFPSDWRRHDIEGQPDSVLFSPYVHEESPRTFISAYVEPLDYEAVAEDLKDLSEAVNEGLQQMDGFALEQATDDALNNLLKFDRTFTFRENGETRKRRTWIMYVSKLQFVFTYQGESVDDYEFWLPMGNTFYFNVKLPDSLWFATDRTLSGLPKS
jgi:hypothetical protein